jgi:hypothetical protein
VARLQADRRIDEATHVGRYLFYFPKRIEPLRVAVDHNDARGIRDRQAYKWTDVYFNVNRWPNLDYGTKLRSPGDGQRRARPSAFATTYSAAGYA